MFRASPGPSASRLLPPLLSIIFYWSIHHVARTLLVHSSGGQEPRSCGQQPAHRTRNAQAQSLGPNVARHLKLCSRYPGKFSRRKVSFDGVYYKVLNILKNGLIGKTNSEQLWCCTICFRAWNRETRGWLVCQIQRTRPYVPPPPPPRSQRGVSLTLGGVKFSVFITRRPKTFYRHLLKSFLQNSANIRWLFWIQVVGSGFWTRRTENMTCPLSSRRCCKVSLYDWKYLSYLFATSSPKTQKRGWMTDALLLFCICFTTQEKHKKKKQGKVTSDMTKNKTNSSFSVQQISHGFFDPDGLSLWRSWG